MRLPHIKGAGPFLRQLAAIAIGVFLATVFVIPALRILATVFGSRP